VLHRRPAMMQPLKQRLRLRVERVSLMSTPHGPQQVRVLVRCRTRWMFKPFRGLSSRMAGTGATLMLCQGSCTNFARATLLSLSVAGFCLRITCPSVGLEFCPQSRLAAYSVSGRVHRERAVWAKVESLCTPFEEESLLSCVQVGHVSSL